MNAETTIQPPVGTHPNSARGEVLLPIVEGKAPFPVRFSLRALHNLTQRTGWKPADVAVGLAEDFIGTIGELVTSAVRVCVPGAQLPADFEVGDALDLIERLTPTETETLVGAIMAAVKVNELPLFQALMSNLPQPLAPADETSGANSSTSDSAS